MKYILIAFAFSFGVMNALGQSNLIPAPAEYSVRSGSISSKELAGLREKVRISPKALLRLLKDRKLEDWQLKSAYQLELGKKGVKIVAADEEGVFYARQTLKMMASMDSSVTCCTILDWPRFRYRGVMLDESRHFQGKAFVLKQLEMMALLKMNRFHFHLVDNPGWRVQIDAYPRLTNLTAWRPQAFFWDWEKNEIGGPFVEEGTPDAYGGYYTKQDIADILSFAEERHIEVIPEIEMPGHNYETRYAFPELACSLPKQLATRLRLPITILLWPIIISTVTRLNIMMMRKMVRMRFVRPLLKAKRGWRFCARSAARWRINISLI